MFQTMSCLSCHSQNVLFRDLNFSCISKKYILERWTKCAKYGSGFNEYTRMEETLKSFMRIYINGLMKESFTVMTLAENDLDSEEISQKYLYQAKIEIIKYQSEFYSDNHEKNENNVSRADPITWCKDQVLDPINKKYKGNGYGRIKKSEKKSITKAIEK